MNWLLDDDLRFSHLSFYSDLTRLNAHSIVTFADNPFQPWAIDDLYLFVPILNETLLTEFIYQCTGMRWCYGQHARDEVRR